MDLDEKLLETNNEPEEPDQIDDPRARVGALKEAQQSSKNAPAKNNQESDNLEEAKHLARAGAQLVAGNKLQAAKTILTDKKARQTGLYIALGGCGCCLLVAFGWLVIISLLLKVITNPLAAAGLAFEWLWNGVKTIFTGS